MSYKKLKVFKLKNRLKILKYSLGSRLINSVPKGLKHTYEFIRWLNQQGIFFKKNKSLIEFNYPIDNKTYVFLLDESSSDSDVFKQIIVDEEYKYVQELIYKYNIVVKHIVDAGANVGYTSIYLSHFYPAANIVALEPNKSTFIRLSQNLKINSLKKTVAVQKGLWNKDTYLKADYSFRDRQDWAFRLEETTNETEKLFETVSVDGLMKSLDWESIDFFKIDIEGGEKVLFQDKEELDWLAKVKVMAIEIHDEFNCREDIESILKEHGFSLFYSGELTIGINKSCIK